MNPNGVTVKGVADALRLSESATWSFAHAIESYYKPRRLQRVGKKHRPIDAMTKVGKKRLRFLHRWFQRRRMFHPTAHGGVSGRSCFTSAARHLGKKFVWTRDASNCFPSISPTVFEAELVNLGFAVDVAKLLTLLCQETSVALVQVDSLHQINY